VYDISPCLCVCVCVCVRVCVCVCVFVLALVLVLVLVLVLMCLSVVGVCMCVYGFVTTFACVVFFLWGPWRSWCPNAIVPYATMDPEVGAACAAAGYWLYSITEKIGK
jgi:hypothetical protein